MARNITDLKKDRMRYTKNTSSATQAYIAIIFNVLYFISIYSYNKYAGDFYYNKQIGFSVISNLLFLLIAFLSSEGVKNYKISYSVVFIPLGLFQLLRIIGIPMNARKAEFSFEGSLTRVMNDKQFIFTCICLCCSALACFATAYTGIKKAKTLKKYEKTLSK